MIILAIRENIKSITDKGIEKKAHELRINMMKIPKTKPKVTVFNNPSFWI